MRTPGPAPPATIASGFTLLGWTVEAEACQLHRGGDTVRLEPKVMAVLVYLAERHGRVVSRDELLEAVWPDVVVTDSAVNRCVSELRRVFDDDPRAARVIETIPKRGYRLLAPVEAPAHAGQRSAPGAEPAVTAPVGSQDERKSRRWSRSARFGLGALVVLVGLVAGSLALEPFEPAPPLESRPLTTLPGIERDAALAPDGSRVAFVWRSPEAPAYDLYVQDLATSEPVALTATRAHERFPAWSPDGRWIAFARGGAGACGIFRVSALGTSERRLADCASVIGLSWSPDGAWIAFGEYDREAKTSRIVLLSPETLERRLLTSPTPGTRGDFHPVFAPDGASVAFVRGGERYGTARLFRASLAGGTPRPLTPVLVDVEGFTWDAETGHLLVAAEHRGIRAMWRAASPTTLERVSLPLAWGPKYPVAAAGRTVVEEWTYDLDIVSVGGEAAFPTTLLTSTRADEHPALAPRGDRVAFVSNRAGEAALWVGRSDGSLVRPLRQPIVAEGERIRAPSWSPDGRWLVVEVQIAGGVDVYAVSSEGGRPRRLTRHVAADVSPSVSRDGRWVYFGSIRGGNWQVWKVPFEGGEAVQVTREGGYRALESADGRALFFARYGEPGLWRRNLDDDGPPRRKAPLHAVDWGNWAVVERGLVAVDRSGEAPRVVVWEEGGDVPALWAEAGPIVRGEVGLAASLDGRVVLVTQIRDVESDLVLVGERAP